MRIVLHVFSGVLALGLAEGCTKKNDNNTGPVTIHKPIAVPARKTPPQVFSQQKIPQPSPSPSPLAGSSGSTTVYVTPSDPVDNAFLVLSDIQQDVDGSAAYTQANAAQQNSMDLDATSNWMCYMDWTLEFIQNGTALTDAQNAVATDFESSYSVQANSNQVVDIKQMVANIYQNNMVSSISDTFRNYVTELINTYTN